MNTCSIGPRATSGSTAAWTTDPPSGRAKFPSIHPSGTSFDGASCLAMGLVPCDNDIDSSGHGQMPAAKDGGQAEGAGAQAEKDGEK